MAGACQGQLSAFEPTANPLPGLSLALGCPAKRQPQLLCMLHNGLRHRVARVLLQCSGQADNLLLTGLVPAFHIGYAGCACGQGAGFIHRYALKLAQLF
eukprot:40102-Eustigmatos_ZCMA.PRE.1